MPFAVGVLAILVLFYFKILKNHKWLKNKKGSFSFVRS